MNTTCNSPADVSAETTMTLAQDPRLDSRIAEGLALMPTSYSAAPAIGADYHTTLAAIAAMEEEDRGRHELLQSMLPEIPTVAVNETSITTADGHALALTIHRPIDQERCDQGGDLPGVVHLHGGGMAMMSAQDPGYHFLRSALAQTGLVVIGVEFRNSAGRLGAHPFPTGLNDCAEAVRWAHTNKERLNISSVMVGGESGGGNLSLATALKAKREGWMDCIDGVYASCPFISGSYANPPAELASVLEFDGYLLDQAMTHAMVTAYDPHGELADHPLAWPLHAQPADLANLPPHVISVNELDPLRDEGLAFAQMLKNSGVDTCSRTVAGTPHGGELMFNLLVPDLFEATLASIHQFAQKITQR